MDSVNFEISLSTLKSAQMVKPMRKIIMIPAAMMMEQPANGEWLGAFLEGAFSAAVVLQLLFGLGMEGGF